jgi:hypothetical protein
MENEDEIVEFLCSLNRRSIALPNSYVDGLAILAESSIDRSLFRISIHDDVWMMFQTFKNESNFVAGCLSKRLLCHK